MKKLFSIVLLLCVFFGASAQNQGVELDDMSGFFNSDDHITPVDDERYFTAPDGIYTHTQVMNIPASFQADLLHKVLIIVDFNLYSELTSIINRYAYDIHYVYGCSVIMELVNSETCQDIKSLISSYQTNLDGCVFIGDIVPAWYQTVDVIDFNMIRKWPCDLYYMDLTGNWIDTEQDGYFDHYDGDMEPEIFVGRISTANMGSLIGEIEGMQLYMDKNHKFWIGHQKVNKRKALAYTNSPWHTRPYFNYTISALYGGDNKDCFTPNDPTFGKADYMNRINNDQYEFVQLACHSRDTIHTNFGLTKGNYTIEGNEIFSNGIKAFGFNLFCCSACRWTSATSTNAFLAGDYIYSPKSEALSAVGSTKVGSMDYFADFYSSLGQERTMGQALVDWWNEDAFQQPNLEATLCWYFGLTIIGDPLVNFFHCTNSTCQEQITLTSYDSNNTPLSYYLTSEKITVAPPATGSFTIPVGDHCILNAPTVEIKGEFLCPYGSSMEILNEGCKDNCDE